MADDVPVPAILELLRGAVAARARDLILTTGAPPFLRIASDELVPIADQPKIDDARRVTYAVLTEAQKHSLESAGALACSFGIRDLGRFRLRVHHQRGSLAASFRVLPSSPPSAP